MALKESIDESCELFQRRYGCEPTIVVAAPGRVNLMGDHVDYHGGLVLPMAIERYTVIAGKRRGNASESDTDARDTGIRNEGASAEVAGVARVFSVALGEELWVRLGQQLQPAEASWSNYVCGIIDGFQARGAEIPDFDAVIVSDVPLGGGLSSSAALAVAMATFLELLLDCRLGPVDKAILCQSAEHQFAGVPCGLMDPLASILGQQEQLMLIDCAQQQIRPVPLNHSDIAAMVIHCGVTHDLSSGGYAQRRQESERALQKLGVASYRELSLERLPDQAAEAGLSEMESRRARHVVSECCRTLQVAEALAEQNWTAVGQLFAASHESLSRDYEVSCAELDCLVGIASEIPPADGMLGIRMTGGGFGGSVVALIRQSQFNSLAVRIADAYRRQTGIEAQFLCSRPAQGALRVPLELVGRAVRR